VQNLHSLVQKQLQAEDYALSSHAATPIPPPVRRKSVRFDHQQLDNQIREARRALLAARWNRDRTITVGVLLVALVVANGFLVPNIVTYPLSPASILAGVALGFWAWDDLRREDSRRKSAAKAREFLNESIVPGQLANTTLIYRLSLICVAVSIFQGWLEIATRPDLRASLPALGRILDSGSQDFAASVVDTQLQTNRRIQGSAPSTLGERFTTPAALGSDIYVWPSNPNAPNMVARLSGADDQKRSLAWDKIETKGAIPAFRYAPDVVGYEDQIHIWGGFLDPPSVSDGERRTIINGATLNLTLRQWNSLPDFPRIKGILRTRMQLNKGALTIVSIGTDDAGKKGWMKVHSLSENAKAWRNTGNHALGDFIPRSAVIQNGIIVLDGSKFQGSRWLTQVNDTAQQLLGMMGATKSYTQSSQPDEYARKLVFRLSRDDQQDNVSPKLTALLPLDVPPLMANAEILSELPGLLVLSDFSQSLVVCRFEPLECDLPRDSRGESIKTSKQNIWVGQRDGNIARIWDRQGYQALKYDFVTRSLDSQTIAKDLGNAEPLFQMSRNRTLVGQWRGNRDSLDHQMRVSFNAVSCSVVPAGLLAMGQKQRLCRAVTK
jgi:hypothetical protein